MTGNGKHNPAWMCPKSVVSVSLGCVDAFALTVRASSDTRRELGQMDTACSSPSAAAARRVQCSRSFLTQGIRHGTSCGFDDPRGYSMIRLHTGATAAPCHQPKGLRAISACPTRWALTESSSVSSQAGQLTWQVARVIRAVN